LKNADHFDPQLLRRYTVFRVYYEFPGQLRQEEKFFVVLKHARGKHDPVCCCIKPTSKVERYKADQSLMNGAVFYGGKTLPFFSEDTVIDPERYFEIPIPHLIKQANCGRYKVEGQMPPDFHGRLVKAIRESKLLERKTAEMLLGCVNEKWSDT
jgi:hypothetical protein